ncbi:hypothetical protein D3C85_710870 [compost metagenome]
MHGPEDDRGTDDGRQRVALAEDREEIAQSAEQQHEVADVAQPGTDPVAPGRGKSHVVAEPGLGVGVHPAIQVRFAIGQGLEDERQGEHAHRGNAPADENGADIRTGCHILR